MVLHKSREIGRRAKPKICRDSLKRKVCAFDPIARRMQRALGEHLGRTHVTAFATNPRQMRRRYAQIAGIIGHGLAAGIVARQKGAEGRHQALTRSLAGLCWGRDDLSAQPDFWPWSRADSSKP